MTKPLEILLIDDDEDDFVNIRDLLNEVSSSKYVLFWQSTYKEGIQALNRGGFDACLLDYKLGEKTGLELLSEVQSSASTCPIIFLTGLGDFDLDMKAMESGASDYLVKSHLTSPLLERSIRYAIKQAKDFEELKESKAQILQQDRLASLGLMASSLAHEIGTPLGIIRSRAELSLRKSSENEALEQDLTVIISQIDRISKLVNSLLHLARQRKSSHSSAVDLDLVLADVLNLLLNEFEHKHVSLVQNIQRGLTVKAEPGPLGQVFLNLLINALHAVEKNPENGRRSEVILQVKSEGSEVHVKVQDNGVGIPAENLTQLFKPFFTTKEIGQGTGLGLATSMRIVNSWGGNILVQSAVGSGSTFTVTLPGI